MMAGLFEVSADEMTTRLAGAIAERDAIVRFLRAQHASCTDPGCAVGALMKKLAEAVERGAHVGGSS